MPSKTADVLAALEKANGAVAISLAAAAALIPLLKKSLGAEANEVIEFGMLVQRGHETLAAARENFKAASDAMSAELERLDKTK